VSSCAHGHPFSPGAESCAVCGDDVRPCCYQGHRSAAGSRFCETCGAMLAADPAAGAADLPAADLVTEYTSRPFNEFLMEDAGETGDHGAPPRPDPAATAAAVSPGSADPASSAAAVSPGSAADPASAPPNGRPRSRTLTVALGAAVITAAGVAGGLTLLHQRTGQQAQAGPSLGRAPTAPASLLPTAPASVSPTAPAAGPPAVPPTVIAPTTPTAPAARPPAAGPPTAPAAVGPTTPSAPAAPPFAAPTAPAAVAAPGPAASAAPTSALPTSSPMPTLTVVPARRTAPASIGQWAAWIGRRDQYQSLPAAEHGLQRSWQPQQFGERWRGRAEWPGVRWGVSPDRGGPGGGPQQWQHDGGYQR
jgi:hypothetical protein